MATIRKRKNGWQAEVCCNRVRRAKTFARKDEAKRWAAKTMLELQSGEKAETRWTLAELCEEFENVEGPTRGNKRYEMIKLRWWGNSALGSLRAADITVDHLQDFLDARARQVQPSSARREFILLQSVFSWAVRRHYLKANPCHEVRKPADNPPRERTASAEEIEKLYVAAGWECGTVPTTAIQRSIAAFVLSCLTGMRGGEIIRIRESFINFDAGTITLPAAITKTRTRRVVAFGKEAGEILKAVMTLGLDPIFGLIDQQRDTLFRKARDRAGLGDEMGDGVLVRQGLHFHDGRATFCTWAASPGPDGEPHLDVLSLAKQIGHKNLRQLMTYFRPRPEDLANRLA